VCENISTCLPASVPDFSFAERFSFVATPSLAYNLRCCTREQGEGKVRSTLRRQRCPLHKRVSTDRFPLIDSADREHQILCFPLKSLLPYIVVHDRCARTNLCSILVYSRIFFLGSRLRLSGSSFETAEALTLQPQVSTEASVESLSSKTKAPKKQTRRSDSIHETPVFPHSIFTE
jgi:hypothetical protein